EVKTEIVRNGVCATPKIPPTRIPTSVQQQLSPPSPKQNQSAPIQFGETQQQQQQQLQQQQPIRKSKIPPPVPVRRSYAS
ncbi:PREDICTED: putative mediator of RNA polymerase II transcription subunit 21, partial [Rhagoletis zephyria]|uniref:putative mediator of RNA polymerase II transcription subunit 21 n=1 Tax=Rhagoletis zephyria TaxID=28612 RepID=UPI000811A0F2